MSARAVADLTAGVILATVEIGVPPERVFRALSDPRELAVWWGSPETYTATTWEADFRVGGTWRVDGKGADGKPYAVWGAFLEIDPPRCIVQTWQHDWEAAHPETKITYTLENVAGGTRLSVRHEGFGSRTESCTRHQHGWDRVLGWLVRYVT
jgi:uncharacterized protein YndB with AHSA1/START domain